MLKSPLDWIALLALDDVSFDLVISLAVSLGPASWRAGLADTV